MGDSPRTKWEEGGDDGRSAGAGCLGLHTRDSGRYKGGRTREGEEIPKSRSWFESQSETRLREDEADSNRGSASRGEYVLRFSSYSRPQPPKADRLKVFGLTGTRRAETST